MIQRKLKKMREVMAETARKKSVFRNMKVFINREVPFRPLYFSLLCGGAKAVGWDRAESPFGADDEDVTHQIVDRPPSQLDMKSGREYIQPQWVLDSFNTGCQLPVGPYAPGKAPPPHLSPFVDDQAEGYVPRQREVLNALVSEISPSAKAAGAGTAAGGDAPVDAKDRIEQFNEELKAESKGVWYSDFKEEKAKKAAELMEGDEEVKAPRKELTPQDEDTVNAKALMSKKHKRLLQRIEKGKNEKAKKAAELMEGD